MRRKEKEIIDKSEIESIIYKSMVCRLGLANDGTPYIVPLCFGYDDNALYFHGARAGKKMEMIRKNPSVCFEFDINTEVRQEEQACQWGMSFQSVIGFGKATLLEDPDDKRHALDIIMRQYTDQSFTFDDKMLNRTAVIRVDIETMTGKQSGF